MAVVNIPTARALMMRGDRMRIMRHGKKIAVFPDWRNMSERYSGTISMQWGAYEDTQVYDNNFISWIEPWETKPTLPAGGVAFRAVPLPPVYVLNMYDRSSEEYSAAIDLCESAYNISFVRDKDSYRCAWAYAQAEGASPSEQVRPGYMCCASQVPQGDPTDESQELGGKCVALAFSVSGRNLFGFIDPVGDGGPVFASAFTSSVLLDGADTATCEGLALFDQQGNSLGFPVETGDTYTDPAVCAYLEVRQINALVPTAYTVHHQRVGAYRRETNSIPGVFGDIGGSPFVYATVA